MTIFLTCENFCTSLRRIFSILGFVKVDILKSQLATRCTICNDYMADFWEFFLKCSAAFLRLSVLSSSCDAAPCSSRPSPYQGYTCTSTHTQTHARIHTHTLSLTHTHIPMYAHTHPLSLSLARAHGWACNAHVYVSVCTCGVYVCVRERGGESVIQMWVFVSLI